MKKKSNIKNKDQNWKSNKNKLNSQGQNKKKKMIKKITIKRIRTRLD
jgi:hypothetical protein